METKFNTSYKTMTGAYIPCDRCIHREFLNCYECKRCLVISWINFEDKYLSTEQSTTDIVKSSQLGFEVPENGKQGEAA